MPRQTSRGWTRTWRRSTSAPSQGYHLRLQSPCRSRSASRIRHTRHRHKTHLSRVPIRERHYIKWNSHDFGHQGRWLAGMRVWLSDVTARLLCLETNLTVLTHPVLTSRTSQMRCVAVMRVWLACMTARLLHGDTPTTVVTLQVSTSQM